MFKRLFGKKNDGFYMQADESQAPAPLEKAAAPIETKASSAVEKSELLAAESAPANKTSEVVAEKSSKATKTSIKDKKKAKSEKGEKKTAPTVETVSIAPTATAESTITNFATDYLIQPSSMSSRRRPGANMKQFMDMARQVETKKSPGQRAKVN